MDLKSNSPKEDDIIVEVVIYGDHEIPMDYAPIFYGATEEEIRQDKGYIIVKKNLTNGSYIIY